MDRSIRSIDPRLVLLVALGTLVVVMGVALALSGVGAEMAVDRRLSIVVRAEDLEQEVAELVAPGDPIFTDAGGMRVGEITEVSMGPDIEAVPDAEGGLNAAEDPTAFSVEVTIEAEGREGDGIVALHNEVIQAGKTFNLISREYYLRGTVVSVDVR